MSLINDALKLAGEEKRAPGRVQNFRPTSKRDNGAVTTWPRLATMLILLFAIGAAGLLLWTAMPKSKNTLAKADETQLTTTENTPTIPAAATEQQTQDKKQPAKNSMMKIETETTVAAETTRANSPSADARNMDMQATTKAVAAKTTGAQQAKEPPPVNHAEIADKYKVSVIVVGAHASSAIINNKMVKIGDYLADGAKVANIEKGAVTIKVDNAKYILTTGTF